MSFMGSIVAIVILLIKALFKDKLGAAWHYYIWFLLMIRLIMPYAPEASISIFNLIPQSSLMIDKYIESQDTNNGIDLNIINSKDSHYQGRDNTHSVPGSSQGISSTSPSHWYAFFEPKTLSRALQLLWIAGVLTVVAYNLIGCLLLQGRIRELPKHTLASQVDILTKCMKKIKAKKMPEVICYPETRAPSLYGVLKPKIIISQDMVDRLTPEELEHIYLHELIHIRRGDILINWLMMIIQAIHWFNPMVWYAFNKVRKDREIFCNAQVLTYLEPEKRKNYGNTIISLIEFLSKPDWNQGTIGMATSKSEIKRRIIMIKKFSKNSFRWSIIAAILMVLIGGICLTNAKGLANSAPPSENNNDSVVNRVEDSEEEQDTNVEIQEPTETEEHQVVDETDGFPQKPQVAVEVDIEMVEREQKQVDEGHSPWQLSPFAVTQTFVGLQISPDGINGDFPVDTEDMKVAYETNEEIIIEVSGDKTPVSRVYLKRLVRQDENGIWTVVGYDPIEN